MESAARNWGACSPTDSDHLRGKLVRVCGLADVCADGQQRLRQRHLPGGLPSRRHHQAGATSVPVQRRLPSDLEQPVHPYVVVSHRFDGPHSEEGHRMAKRNCPHRCAQLCGALLSTEINCTAVDSYSNAQWPKTAAGSTAAGTCGAGFVAGTPLRACLITGDWSDTVTNPCERMWSLRRPKSMAHPGQRTTVTFF